MSWNDVRNQSQVDLLSRIVWMIIPIDFFGGGASKQQPTNEYPKCEGEQQRDCESNVFHRACANFLSM